MIDLPKNWKIRGAYTESVIVTKIIGYWCDSDIPIEADMYSLHKSEDKKHYVVGPGRIPELIDFYEENNTIFHNDYTSAWHDLMQRIKKESKKSVTKTNVREKAFVTFYSPGTFVSETTTKPISSWDCKKAAAMAKTIKERYNATPYGFQFSKRLTADPISDGRGGTLRVQSKTTKESGTYYLGGKLRTYDEVKKENKDDERILRSNMLGNNWCVVIENTNSYQITQPFEPDDVIVDQKTGKILRTGKDPDLKAYRKKFKAEKANDRNGTDY